MDDEAEGVPPLPPSSPATGDAPVTPADWRGVDAPGLIALMRIGDEDAKAEAYRRTFGSPLGQLVLVDTLAECGVGAVQGRGVSADDRHYLAGRMDAGLELMTRAGFDQPSAVLMHITETLEGRTHDRDDADHPRDDELP